MNRIDETTPSPFFERIVDAHGQVERAEVLRDVAATSPQEQFEVNALLADVEGLRQELSAGLVHPTLTASLLDIARHHPKPAFDWREIADRPVNWNYVAACFAVVATILTYFVRPQPPQRIEALDTGTATRIGELALQSGKTLTWPAGHSDPTEILAVWHECALPFTPDIIQPSDPVRFVAGGAVAFNGNPALFTQWATDHSRYIMYQFDKKSVGLPANFTQASVVLDRTNTRVNIWPGNDGKTGWALISIDAPNGNPFTDVSAAAYDSANSG